VSGVVFDVRSDVSAVTRHLSSLANEQIPFATALALTRTAQFAQGKLKDELRRAFDRPTPYTLNATFVQPATKQRLWALVKLKDEAVKGNPAVRFLIHQIRGGGRTVKGFEKLLQRAGVMPEGWFAVPASGAPLDQYGNVRGGTINRILSQLQASRDPLTRETTAAKAKRNRTRTAGRYFVAYPGSVRTSHLAPGIYERLSAFGGSGVRPVFLYVQRAPRYRRRLRFLEVTDQAARMRFPIEFALAARQAIRTAR